MFPPASVISPSRLPLCRAPALAPRQSKPDDSSIGSRSNTSSTPPATTNTDTGSDNDDLIDEVTVGAWATHTRATLWFDADLPREADDGDDEFVLPDDAFAEYAVPRIVPQPVPQIVPQTDEEDGAETSTWLVQLAQFATTAILALCGFYDGPRAACRGGGGDEAGGGGGGGGGPGRPAGDGRRGRRRSAGGSLGPNGGNNYDNSDDASILDKVEDTLNGFMSGLGRGMMDALGFEDRDEVDDKGPLPSSTDERIARWRAYTMSWRARDGARGENRRDSKRDLDTLEWDVRRLKQGCDVKAMIQRIIRKFLESFPAIGYTQVLEYSY